MIPPPLPSNSLRQFPANATQSAPNHPHSPAKPQPVVPLPLAGHRPPPPRAHWRTYPPPPAAPPAAPSAHPHKAAPPLSTLPADWDAIIVGAGPAGATAAALLAQRHWKILLVERSPWPRDKACGGCLNAAALAMLHHAHLSQALHSALPLTRFEIHTPRRSRPASQRPLSLDLPQGAAIDRPTFDAALVSLAQSRGITFLPNTHARLLPTHSPTSDFREVALTHNNNSTTLRTRLLLAADGLAGTSLSLEPWAKWSVAPASRIGIALTLPPPSHPTPPISESPHNPLARANTISMYLSAHGYIGAVLQPTGLLHLGASLDPAACHAARGPLPLLQQLLASHGIHLPSLHDTPFLGTKPLTARRQTLGGPRALTLGDACGYIEPFTGEGISWSIRSALALSRLLPQNPQHLARWDQTLPTRWQALHHHEIASRQRWCRLLRPLLHRPTLAQTLLHSARHLPYLPTLLAHRICA